VPLLIPQAVIDNASVKDLRETKRAIAAAIELKHPVERLEYLTLKARLEELRPRRAKRSKKAGKK